jgi:hypothetical protein
MRDLLRRKFICHAYTCTIFHYFPITRDLRFVKCRQISVLELIRGSLGSFYTAIVRRPLSYLACRLYITKRLLVQTGHFPYFPNSIRENAAHTYLRGISPVYLLSILVL